MARATWGYLGLLGIVAAKLGDREEALRYSEQIEATLVPGEYMADASVWRAAIAAHLGELEQAMEFLQKAERQGLYWGMGLHTGLMLYPPYGYLPFEEFRRPKG